MNTKHVGENLVFIIIAVLCVIAWWFYRPQIIIFYNSTVSDLSKMFTPPAKLQTASNPVETGTPKTVKDCGVGVAPDLKNPSTYENNQVLACLGESARSCAPARAVLQDPFFPNVFEVESNGTTCNFKLSYTAASTLTDITGKKLAGQYISCPINNVKVLDESNPQKPVFNAPSTTNASKYASQIYFYGAIGLFIENNLEQNKIQNQGCSGPYIQSVIKSFQSAQAGN